MNISTRARASVTLLLALSLLVQSVPLTALAEGAPIEPALIVDETPAEPVVEEPAVEEPIVEEPIVEEPVEEKPVVEVPPVIEEPTEPSEPVIEEPIAEELQFQMFSLEMSALEEETSSYFTIDAAIDLPNGCEITDASGTTHIFPIATTTEYLAVCALVEALENDTISEVSVTDSNFGLYVTSVNGIAAGENEYWSIWINGGYGNCGVSCQTLSEGDEIAFVRTAYDPATYAETQMDRLTLTISSLEETYDNVLVPETCTVSDASGATHTFPAGDNVLGVCALTAAVAEGHIAAYVLTNASFGLYVSGVDNITIAADEYWALWLNGAYAECGIVCLPVETGDTLSLVRTTFANVESDRYDFRIIGSVEVETETETDPGSETGGTGDDETDSFSTADAFSYLVSLQEEDGSIENDLVTDWAALAFSVSGAPSSAKSLLKQYLREEEVDMDNPSDYIRHAMALLALDINPYTGGPEDYITPIVESFDGTQLGEDAYINDDIFSLFPLTHAGYSEDDELIKDIVAFIVSQQASDGSWEGIDMTAAAVQALSPLDSLPGVPAALEKAEAYLRSEQESDGGFGDVFATTWVIQAIEVLGESPSTWEVGGKDPIDYLAALQQEDGSVTTSSGTQMDAAWATAYAIPAIAGKSWHDLLDSVRKQEPKIEEDSTDNTDANDAGEVLGVEDAGIPEPLPPAFTFEAPVSDVAPTIAQATTPKPAPTVEQAPEEVVEEPTQTASVADAGENSGLMRTLASLWQNFLNFLKNLFA